MKKILVGLIFATFLAIELPNKLDSANLTTAADTLSNSRLSYMDALSALHLVNTTLVSVGSTANLFTGDSVLVGDTATAGNPAGTAYTVDDIFSGTQFTTTGGLDATDIQSGDLVIATRSATHTVTFTTATAVPNGAIRILIPSGTNGTNDGIPNHDGFDYGVTVPSLTAPTNGGVTSWETATATASGATGCTAGNHCFETRYNGTNSVNAALTFVIGGANKLINPSRGSGSAGTANTYTVTIQHLSSMTSQYVVVDTTTVKIAVVESVRVTATVDPTINFTIAGVASGQTRCNVVTSVTSTATSVPLGTLALDTFTNAAQNLKVSTNGVSGYAVTTIENDQLGKDGGTATFIADTSGDASATEDVWDDWTLTASKGFGYSIQNNDAFDVTFTYASASSSCAGGAAAFCSRRFPATADSETIRQLFRSTTVADSEDVDVCYRAVISTTQAAGDYENNITYTATATF